MYNCEWYIEPLGVKEEEEEERFRSFVKYFWRC